MNTKHIISLTALVALTGALSYGAAGDLNPETPIGLLARLYAEGSADQAPRILASLYRKNLLQLALIGYKEPQRFPMLYRGAMNELSRQKERFRQLLQENNGDVQVALFDAIRNDKAWAIDYLVQNGADLNARDKYDWTALMWAAHEGHGAMVAQLIAAGADLNVRNKDRITALMKAARLGHGAIVAQLIAARADLNVRNIDGTTALIYAAIYGRGAIVAQLIAARADVDVRDIAGWTALMYAAIMNHEAIAAQLIAAEADLNVKNNGGMTALMLAAGHGHEAIVAQLIAAGANVDERDNGGNTALSLAERAVTNEFNQAGRDRARAIVVLLTRGR